MLSVKYFSVFGKGKILHIAKFVAGIVGQIISMQAVLGNLVRLSTRELYNCITVYC